MRLSVLTSPARPWADVLRIARHCDDSGWYGVWSPDHFMPHDWRGATPLDGPMHEAFTLLAGLAASTSRVRLGVMVLGNLYRHPAVVAHSAVTTDHVSGGRFVLGLGAGWQANEHAAYGIDLLSTRDRMDAFQESTRIVRSLLREQRTTAKGRFYEVTDAPCDPAPLGPLPILVGGGGERRTLRTTALYADEWNAWTTPESFRHKVSVLDRHCDDIGRDRSQIRLSTQAITYVSHDRSAVERRRAEDHGTRPTVIGSPEEVVEELRAYADAGADEFLVPDGAIGDASEALDVLALIGEEVAPHLP